VKKVFDSRWSLARWYDRKTRSYVVQTLDPDGNQVGDAAYCGTREWADAELTAREAELFRSGKA
jgi:hypothetical protein